MRQKNMVIIIALIMFILFACGATESTIQTAIAQTQIAMPTNTTEFLTTTTQYPTITPTTTKTPLQLPSIPSLPAPQYDDIFAWNYLSEQTSGGVTIKIARILVGNKDSVEKAIDSDFDKDDVFLDKPIVGEIIFIVTNNSNKTISIFPDQGTVVIGSEQIELRDYLFGGTSFGDDISGDIYPGVTAIGGLWFGIKRIPLEEINSMMIAFMGPSENLQSLGSDYHFQLDLSEHKFLPMPEELK